MKGSKRQNVAKRLTVDMPIEIPEKCLYGIQLVGFASPYKLYVWQMIKYDWT